MMGSYQPSFLTANTVCAVDTSFPSATYVHMPSRNNGAPTHANQHFRYQKGGLA
jgi:hypothetical protein